MPCLLGASLSSYLDSKSGLRWKVQTSILVRKKRVLRLSEALRPGKQREGSRRGKGWLTRLPSSLLGVRFELF